MAFSRSKEKGKLIKYFKDNNIAYNEANNKVETEIVFKDKIISIIINIRKINEKLNLDLYQRLNSFNLVSQYFVAKISNDNILYIEYNTMYSDNVVDIFDNAIGSLNDLLNYIESL